jgi:hypothetical protein
MEEYRAYAIGDDGHFIAFEPMVCSNDAEAIGKAKLLADVSPVELWCGARLIVRLESRQPK